jgi:hypothetical protein
MSRTKLVLEHFLVFKRKLRFRRSKENILVSSPNSKVLLSLRRYTYYYEFTLS